MSDYLTIATLRPSHHADLRALARNPRFDVQRVRLNLFRRLGLVRLGSLQADGLRKSWVLTEAGEQVIANAPPSVTPGAPRSMAPQSGYWVDRKAGAR